MKITAISKIRANFGAVKLEKSVKTALLVNPITLFRGNAQFKGAYRGEIGPQHPSSTIENVLHGKPEG
jgi:hypothetical protein